jgi:hypothetical protein
VIKAYTETPQSYEGDVIVGPLYADRPPTRGVAGWADWLLGEPVAGLLLAGKLRAKPGETLLLASRPPFRAPKIVLVGLFAPAATKAEAEDAAEKYAAAVRGLAAYRVLIESPYADGAFFAERFAKIIGQANLDLAYYHPETPCRI